MNISILADPSLDSRGEDQTLVGRNTAKEEKIVNDAIMVGPQALTVIITIHTYIQYIQYIIHTCIHRCIIHKAGTDGISAVFS